MYAVEYNIGLTRVPSPSEVNIDAPLLDTTITQDPFQTLLPEGVIIAKEQQVTIEPPVIETPLEIIEAQENVPDNKENTDTTDTAENSDNTTDTEVEKGDTTDDTSDTTDTLKTVIYTDDTGENDTQNLNRE